MEKRLIKPRQRKGSNVPLEERIYCNHSTFKHRSGLTVLKCKNEQKQCSIFVLHLGCLSRLTWTVGEVKQHVIVSDDMLHKLCTNTYGIFFLLLLLLLFMVWKRVHLCFMSFGYLHDELQRVTSILVI